MSSRFSSDFRVVFSSLLPRLARFLLAVWLSDQLRADIIYSEE